MCFRFSTVLGEGELEPGGGGGFEARETPAIAGFEETRLK